MFRFFKRVLVFMRSLPTEISHNLRYRLNERGTDEMDTVL
jgi:hypothetical protein